jgi:hypothetical protein
MVGSSQISKRTKFVYWLARCWRTCNGNLWGMTKVDGRGPVEPARTARNVDIVGPELHVLAGKWPDSADLLSRPIQPVDRDTIPLTWA